MCDYCSALAKAIDRYIAKADNNLAGDLGDEGYTEPKKTVKYVEDIEDSVAEALTDETDYIVKKAEESVDLKAFADDVWPGVKVNDKLKSSITSVFTEQLEKFLPEYTEYYLKQTDRDLKCTKISKRTTAWAKSWSKQLGDIMQLNSHKEIENLLTKSLENGDSVADFTRAIMESGIRDEYYKARRTAITEVLRAHSVAQQESFMQSPCVEEKLWRHTGAYRNQPRENHVMMDGQRVGKAEPFELDGIDGGSYTPMYPRDSSLPPEETINCHCICQPIVNESTLGMSLEERQQLQEAAIEQMDDDWEAELDAENRAKAGIDED